METEIPSKVRRSIDGEAPSWVIRPEVTNTSLRKSANEHCAPENQHQKNIPNEAVFCFHSYIVIIELAFGQQVGAEPPKIFQNSHCAAETRRSALMLYSFWTENNVSRQGEPRESLRERRSR